MVALRTASNGVWAMLDFATDPVIPMADGIPRMYGSECMITLKAAAVQVKAAHVLAEQQQGIVVGQMLGNLASLQALAQCSAHPDVGGSTLLISSIYFL